MSEKSVLLPLTQSEYQMVKALRDMPESPLRDRVLRLMDDLATFARNPRCPELQADGVPCERAESDCDQCTLVKQMLDDITHRMPTP